MPNKVQRLEVRTTQLSPANAEVWVTVVPDELKETTELHGRLVGPRCHYTTTVEVAYPLRPLNRPTPAGVVAMRVIIPEPSWWSPDTPYLYEGPVELHHDGEICERLSIVHGLRQATFGARGFQVNGKNFELKPKIVDLWTESKLMEWREAGYNTLIVSASTAGNDLWGHADRIGFFVLGRLETLESLKRVPWLRGHAGCLGWLVNPNAHADVCQEVLNNASLVFGSWLGWELDEPWPGDLPPEVHFVVGGQSHLDKVPNGAAWIPVAD